MRFADEKAVGAREPGEHGAILHRRRGCHRHSVRTGRERGAQARAAGFDPAGTKAVLTVNIDDYAEIWINNELPPACACASRG